MLDVISARVTARTSDRVRPLPALDRLDLATLRLDELRKALRTNKISFPTPVPTFERHDRADVQWKLVQLYFVLGWSCERIAARYGLIHQRVRQILRTWQRRAVEIGYIQCIPPAEIFLMRPSTVQPESYEPAFGLLPLPPAAASWLSENHQHS